MASKKAAKPQGKAKGIERSPHGEGYERIDQYDHGTGEAHQRPLHGYPQCRRRGSEARGPTENTGTGGQGVAIPHTRVRPRPSEAILKSAMFTEDYSQMVVVKDIEVYSMCEHHMLPFFGKAHVAYIPNGRIVGLSKIPRVVDAYARRLQVQERLTNEIRDCIQET
jgi:GTP cyclohydrolase I